MDQDWELKAACRTVNPDVFFDEIALAKQICKACPVRDECLEAVLVREDGVKKTCRKGIFAGLSGQQRWDIDKQRKQAKAASQPAKADKPKPKKKQQLAACGTRAAYQRHVRCGEPIDEACREANARQSVQYRATGSMRVPAAQ
ncbi:WhiB family transcriptional regulator [Streptomyces sp. NPDC002952]|uniref:WhiB family transcriptional regulator n=1 Tax=Streptomyces sp. NPDC002952 TaxID=3364673 RepID=UPI0036789383